jgi:hypothetical protein
VGITDAWSSTAVDVPPASPAPGQTGQWVDPFLGSDPGLNRFRIAVKGVLTIVLLGVWLTWSAHMSAARRASAAPDSMSFVSRPTRAPILTDAFPENERGLTIGINSVAP